jgi:cytochrome c nitrite reductase small subunit
MSRRASPASRRARGAVAPAVLAALAGVLAGAGTFTFWYADGTAYLSNDPAACVNCHVMREPFESWQKSSHKGFATCNDCHIPHGPLAKWLVKGENGFWHSYKFTFQNFHEPIRIREKNADVLQANCLGCHQRLVSEITAQGAHRGERACVRCHEEVGHGLH